MARPLIGLGWKGGGGMERKGVTKRVGMEGGGKVREGRE